MRAIVIGAAGFIGSRLAAWLARHGQLDGRPLDELVLFDQRAPSVLASAACRVTAVSGDLRQAAVLDSLFASPMDAVFHFAATLTLDAESDYRRALDTNVLAFIELLERCRAQAAAPRLLFASSISTFGGDLPDEVDDHVPQRPGTTYGTHKAIAEQLLSDATRRRFVDGRALRLPIVLTHPGPASGSISDQVAALIREPLRGRTATCRMRPDSRLVVTSVDNVVASFLRLAGLPPGTLKGSTAMNLPALTVTPAQIQQAVARHLPAGSDDLVCWQPDEDVQRIIDGWPRAFTSQRARALGFAPDPSVDALVDAFRASEGGE